MMEISTLVIYDDDDDAADDDDDQIFSYVKDFLSFHSY